MQEDYARASQQAKEATLLPSGPGFQEQRHGNQRPQDYSTDLPQTNQGRTPTGGSRSQELFQYAGGLPPARQLQEPNRTDQGQTQATFPANEPRMNDRAQVISRQPATRVQQYGDPDGQTGSPDLNRTEGGGQNQHQNRQDQDPPAQPRPSNGVPLPQTRSKLARVLGEEPQYSGSSGFGREDVPVYDSRNQTSFLPRRSQSQRVDQTYYPPPASAGAGPNQPYYPPPPSVATTTSQAGGQGLRYGEDGGSTGYGAVEAYKEPKKRRWSLTGGKKWIGDGRIPDA